MTRSRAFRARAAAFGQTAKLSWHSKECLCARSSTDRASDYGSEGWGFESLRACHLLDDGNVSTDTGKFPDPTDGDLGRELQG